MAYAAPRSANRELDEGMTDGKYRKAIMDRGGVVENCTYESRRDLTDGWYGIHEAQIKRTPDGIDVRTPYCVRTPMPQSEYF